MKFSQDSINSGISKLRWGMSVTRVERTKGAVEMTDEQLRRQIARPDADIVLNANHMAKPGARFDVKRDFELSQQHFQLINDNRAAIERVSNITSGFQGKKGNATSSDDIMDADFSSRMTDMFLLIGVPPIRSTRSFIA